MSEQHQTYQLHPTSPLEWAFERAVVSVLAASFPPERWHTAYLGIDNTGFLEFPPLDRAGLIVGREVPVGPYWADFGVLARAPGGTPTRSAIECDGHEFHQKTQQQATRDKARDRYFASVGVTTIRFTGLEILSNPIGCAHEALLIAIKRGAPHG